MTTRVPIAAQTATQTRFLRLRVLRRLLVSATTMIEAIKDDLGYLKLHRSAEVFAGLADGDRTAATTGSQFLAALVAEEAAATRQRRLNARLRFAHFPARRTIEEFDFDFQPSIDRAAHRRPRRARLRPGRHPDPVPRQAGLRQVATSPSPSASAPSRPATAATSPPPPTWSPR